MTNPQSAQGAVQEVLEILQGLLEQAYEVEASMGAMPGADEALEQAISDTRAVLTRLAAN